MLNERIEKSEVGFLVTGVPTVKVLHDVMLFGFNFVPVSFCWFTDDELPTLNEFN